MPKAITVEGFSVAIVDRRVFGSFMLYERNKDCEKNPSALPLHLVSFFSAASTAVTGFPKRIVPVLHLPAPAPLPLGLHRGADGGGGCREPQVRCGETTNKL